MKLFQKDKAFYKKDLILALPIALQSLIAVGVNMLDTIMVGGIGSAGNVYDAVNVGVLGKTEAELAEIEDYDSWIGMASFGIVCSLPLGFRAGTALRHVGWATPFRNDEPTLPSELVVGIAQGGRLSSGFLAWTAGVDVRRRNGDGLAAIVSGEAVLHDAVAIRAGYPFGEDEPGISVGGALLLRWVDVEYALASHGLYGARHHLGLAIRL